MPRKPTALEPPHINNRHHKRDFPSQHHSLRAIANDCTRYLGGNWDIPVSDLLAAIRDECLSHLHTTKPKTKQKR